MSVAGLDRLRSQYHDNLCRDVVAQRRTRDGRPVERRGHPVFNFADAGDARSLPPSVLLAEGVVRGLARELSDDPPAEQTAGKLFTEHTETFIGESLRLMGHMLPGGFFIEMRPSLARIATFDQYEHLDELDRLAGQNPEIAAVLGKDYIVTPDIVIGRNPFSDAEINASAVVVGDTDLARRSPVRISNDRRPTLKASISCKWTMRSDRAQNIRTEAHNLIRNRKGPTPHIVAVTMEPLPSRLESIALGLGDVDCVYHAALDELVDAGRQLDSDDQAENLGRMIDGRRLRDISDLPLDLVS